MLVSTAQERVCQCKMMSDKLCIFSLGWFIVYNVYIIKMSVLGSMVTGTGKETWKINTPNHKGFTILLVEMMSNIISQKTLRADLNLNVENTNEMRNAKVN